MRVTLLFVFLFFKNTFSRLDFYSTECQNYIKKFGLANDSIGVGATSLAFTGNVSYVEDATNVQVNLRYFDSLYDDATYYGLTQEDGKTADSTCLDLKIWKYTSSNYSDPVQVTDLPITASSNQNNKWRYLKFTLNSTELPKKTVQTSNSNRYLYNGFYAVAYYTAETSLVQYTFYFQFVVNTNITNGQVISTVFLPYNHYETIQCTPSSACQIFASSTLKYCTDRTCSNNTIPSFDFAQFFYLQQVVTTSGLTNYYLTDTTIYYIGEGLYHQTFPVSVNNSLPGQTLLLLVTDIVWTNVSILVTSYLSTTAPEAERFLQQTTTTYDPISGTSESVDCIKFTVLDCLSCPLCPTCAEQCKLNCGIAEKQCPKCLNDSIYCFQMLAVAQSILLFIIF